jgi:hypothetical protein
MQNPWNQYDDVRYTGKQVCEYPGHCYHQLTYVGTIRTSPLRILRSYGF